MHRRTPRVLVVEDDERVRKVIEYTLGPQGFDVHSVTSGGDALDRLRHRRYDVLILDRRLPDMDGLRVLRDLPEDDLPTIIVSGRATERDRIEGLGAGADDYVVKPFSPLELVARVKALLRRTDREPRIRWLDHGALVVDLDRRGVTVDGRVVELTAREFDLLAFLAARPGKTFTRDDLLREVWDSGVRFQDPSTVTEHVRRLRLKIEADPAAPRWLVTQRAVGYRFEP